MKTGTAERLTETVESLREQIRRLQAAPRRYLATLRTGVEGFDGLLPGGGLPLGQTVELSGESASGRTRLALKAVASAHREQRLCAWVDGPCELYPPAAAAAGVELERLLIVRPREPEKLAWAALQLVRSGAFACVVLDLTRGAPGTSAQGSAVRLGPAEARKLMDAALRGGSLLLLLTAAEAPADSGLRLRTEARGRTGLEVEVVRSRQGGLGTRALVPWQALYPELELWESQWEAGVPPAVEVSVPRVVRERRWEQRNGMCGILGQRPGRDAPMPALRAGLEGAP